MVLGAYQGSTRVTRGSYFYAWVELNSLKFLTAMLELFPSKILCSGLKIIQRLS